MALISKKNLIPMLLEKGFITSEKNVSYEAYGRTVMAYIGVKDMETRKKLENVLDYEMRQKVSRDYWPGHPTVCVKVSYFKAWHWDE